VHHDCSNLKREDDEEGGAVSRLCQTPSQEQVEEDSQYVDQICNQTVEGERGTLGFHPGGIPLQVHWDWGWEGESNPAGASVNTPSFLGNFLLNMQLDAASPHVAVAAVFARLLLLPQQPNATSRCKPHTCVTLGCCLLTPAWSPLLTLMTLLLLMLQTSSLLLRSSML